MLNLIFNSCTICTLECPELSSPILYFVFLLCATSLSLRGTHDSPYLLCLWVFYFGCSAWVWMNFGRLWEMWPDHWRFSRYITLVQKNLGTGVWCITVGSQKDLRSDSDVLDWSNKFLENCWFFEAFSEKSDNQFSYVNHSSHEI